MMTYRVASKVLLTKKEHLFLLQIFLLSLFHKIVLNLILKNYKEILVDFLGYATYEAYISSDIPTIKVPNPSINGQSLSKEQETTLVKLVTINNNNLSYLPFESKQKVKVKK